MSCALAKFAIILGYIIWAWGVDFYARNVMYGAVKLTLFLQFRQTISSYVA